MKTRRLSRRVLATIAALAVLASTGALASGPAEASPGQIITTIEDDVTAEQLAGALVGEGVTISNVTHTGAEASAGVFEGMGAIGFDAGVILSSGDARTVEGPNTSDSTTGNMEMPGDPDLTAITGLASNDAAVLEFDFVPSTDNLAFEYVFASDEYPEYALSSFNDVFAFFVNGANCATFGTEADAVSINNINAITNAELYRPNHLEEQWVYDENFELIPTPDAIDTELDGLTVVLTCSAVVTPGEVNHIQLAIADTSDSVLDSAVFIQAGSIRSNTAAVAVDDAYSTPENTALTIDAPGVLANDTDVDGDPLTAAVVTEPTNGALALAADGSFTYTPDAGFTGEESFTYAASDGALSSNDATVTINVQAANRISGVVTTPAEAPIDLSNAFVLAYNGANTQYVPSAATSIVPDGPGALTGTYEFVDLPPDTYQLIFVAQSASGITYQWAGESPTRGSSTLFAVTDDGSITAAPEHIVAMSTLQGTVTGDGAPLPGTRVALYGPTDTWLGSYQATVAADGTYSVNSIRGDDYRVYFIAPAGSGHARQWFDGAPTRGLSALLSISDGTVTTGIDAAFGDPAPAT